MAKWYFHKDGAKIKMPSDDLPYLEKYDKIN